MDRVMAVGVEAQATAETSLFYKVLFGRVLDVVNEPVVGFT